MSVMTGRLGPGAVDLRREITPTVHDERARWFVSRIVAAVGVAALLSVVPTPVRGPMVHVFGDHGVVGPVAAGTVAGLWSVGLLLTARGLRHGHRLAWLLTLAFVGAGLWLHLARHNDAFESVLLGLAGGWFLLRERAFRVRVPRLTAYKVLLVTGVAGTMAWALSFDAGPVPNALIVLVFGLTIWALWTFLSPPPPDPLPEGRRLAERERAREVVAAHGDGTLDYFALRDDKRWFFHGDSVVAYAVRLGVCLVSPDPIGPAEERRAVWTAFMEHARGRGWSVSVLGAGPEWVDTYRSFGLRALYLGDEAVVDCTTFSLEGRRMRSLRQACNRIDRAGYTVSFHDPTDIGPELRGDLLRLSTLSREGAFERGFSMTLSRLFDEEDRGLLLSVSRDAEGRPRAFVQWTPAPGIDGWSLDVMRYDTGAGLPNGVMDHLIVHTIQRLAARGETGLGLNFAVLRTALEAQPTTTSGRLGQRLLEAVSGRTQIASLARFNEKFCPGWQPRYVVLSSLDTVACQGLVIVAAEGLSDIPLIGRFLKGVGG